MNTLEINAIFKTFLSRIHAKLAIISSHKFASLCREFEEVNIFLDNLVSFLKRSNYQNKQFLETFETLQKQFFQTVTVYQDRGSWYKESQKRSPYSDDFLRIELSEWYPQSQFAPINRLKISYARFILLEKIHSIASSKPENRKLTPEKLQILTEKFLKSDPVDNWFTLEMLKDSSLERLLKESDFSFVTFTPLHFFEKLQKRVALSAIDLLYQINDLLEKEFTQTQTTLENQIFSKKFSTGFQEIDSQNKKNTHNFFNTNSHDFVDFYGLDPQKYQ